MMPWRMTHWRKAFAQPCRERGEGRGGEGRGGEGEGKRDGEKIRVWERVYDKCTRGCVIQ